MNIYHILKAMFLTSLLKLNKYLIRFNLIKFYRRKIRIKIKKHRPSKLNNTQKKQIKAYYANRGYRNIKTYWHQYYGGFNNNFSVKYVPEDIFHPFIADALNEKKQWPALLDKNLLNTLFKDIKQPINVVNNINGFYYSKGNLISKKEAIKNCLNYNSLVIKPSIESGGGKGVLVFSIKGELTDYNDMSLESLFNLYSKDFIIQEIVNQHSELKKLNPTSLNTIRILSYMKEEEVIVLSSIIRIGKINSFTDNSSSGGISCGINNDGSLKDCGYIQSGKQKFVTDSGVILKEVLIPKFDLSIKLVKKIHYKIPYFKLVAWDIAIDDSAKPLLIEYNTYRMGISSLQLANGPLFGDFTDELLEIGRRYKD